jgi:hypothetical protein
LTNYFMLHPAIGPQPGCGIFDGTTVERRMSVIKRTLHKSIVLFFIFLFPVTITVCGGGDDSGSSTYTLSGRVTTEGGAGLQGVSVTAEGFGWGGCAPPTRTTTTDANGYYAFTETNPPAGQVTITPSKQGYTFSPPSRTAEFKGANISGQDFSATLIPYSISRRVAAASGSGIEGITVTLSGAASMTTATDAYGNYLFTGLLNGSYTLAPSTAAPGYTFTPPSRTVNIEYANVTGLNFTVTTYVISGRVTTAGGIGFSGVSITLSDTSMSTITDATGYYTLTVFQTGSYTITPSMSIPGYTFDPPFRTVEVASGDVTGQDFSTVAYAVSGRIATSEGAGVSGVTVSVAGPASLSSVTDANGDYAVAVVQSGAYTITPSETCNAYFYTPADITITITNADVTGQNFTATAVPHSLSGRISAPDGAGAPGVTVNLSGAASLSTTTNANGDYTFVVAQSGFYDIAPSITDYALKPERRSIALCGADITGQDFAESATWGRLYGSGSLYSIRQTSDNGYIAAGSAYGEVQVFKLSANGGILWQKSYGQGSANAILETTDGYIVTGSTYSFGAGGSDLLVLKLDASGAVLWQKAYGGTGADWGGSILQTADGGYVAAGQHESGAGAYDFWVLRVDASGSIVWQKSYGRGGAHSIRQTLDNGYIAAGSHILKLDADGNRVWQKSYEGAANSIRQTSDGGYIAAGYISSFGAGSGDFWVLKLDPGGNVLWQKAYGETLSEAAYSVRQTSDGGYIVAGYVTVDLNTEFARVLKLDPDGTVSWQKKYGGWPVRYRAYSLDIARDGRYIVSGSGSYFGTFGLVLMIDPYGEGCKVFSSSATATPTTVSPADSSDEVVDTTAIETANAGAPKDTSATASQVCP